MSIALSRTWAMSTPWTFAIPQVDDLLARYVGSGEGWIDPFAGRHSPAEFTNDLDPASPAKDHMLASDYCAAMAKAGAHFKGCLFDPPYSNRQISEHYRALRRRVSPLDTTGKFYASVKDLLAPLIVFDGLAISFGWNSNGFGKARGFEIVEIMLVAHGSAKNDTICTIERKTFP